MNFVSFLFLYRGVRLGLDVIRVVLNKSKTEYKRLSALPAKEPIAEGFLLLGREIGV